MSMFRNKVSLLLGTAVLLCVLCLQIAMQSEANTVSQGPELVSAQMTNNNSVITLTFNEKVRLMQASDESSNENCDYEMYTTGAADYCLSWDGNLNADVFFKYDGVSLRAKDKQVFIQLPTPLTEAHELKVSRALILNSAGRPAPDDFTFSLSPDTQKPYMTQIEVSPDDKKLVLTFNEPVFVNANTNINRQVLVAQRYFNLHPDEGNPQWGEYIGPISKQGTVKVKGNQVTIQMKSALPVLYKGQYEDAIQDHLFIKEDAFRDSAGNTTDLIQSGILEMHTAKIVSTSVDSTNKVITVTFDQLIYNASKQKTEAAKTEELKNKVDFDFTGWEPSDYEDYQVQIQQNKLIITLGTPIIVGNYNRIWIDGKMIRNRYGNFITNDYDIEDFTANAGPTP